MNIQQIMKQAQQMQRKLQENQAILEKKEFEGIASNGYVKIVMMGTGFVKSVNINEELINKEEKDVLEEILEKTKQNSENAATEAEENVPSDKESAETKKEDNETTKEGTSPKKRKKTPKKEEVK